MTFPTTDVVDVRDIQQLEHEKTPKAKRVLIVDSVGTNISGTNPLPVTPIGGSTVTKTEILLFNNANITQNNTTTLISYTVSSGMTFYLMNIIFGGKGDGEFTGFINGNQFVAYRNSASERTSNLFFNSSIKAIAGDLIELKAQNLNYKNITSLFETTLIGYEV